MRKLSFSLWLVIIVTVAPAWVWGQANQNNFNGGGAGSTLPSGTQGQPLVNTNGSTSYATSNLYLDISGYAGTLDQKIASALAIVPANTFVTLDASALGGTTQTMNSNPLAIAGQTSLTCNISGEIRYPAAIIIENVPIWNPCFREKGKGHYYGNGTTKQNGTIFLAGPNMLPAFGPATTVNIAASTGGTGTTSFTFIVTPNTLVAGSLSTNVQVGDIFVKCNSTLGETGTKCAGSTSTGQARGLVIAVQGPAPGPEQITVQTNTATAADTGGGGGVNFVTYPYVKMLGDIAGTSGGPGADPGIELEEATIDAQLNSIAGAIPFVTYSAQNLSEAKNLTLVGFDNMDFDVSGNAAQQFSMHDIWATQGANSTANLFCGLNNMQASNTGAFRNIACALTGSGSTLGVIINARTTWRDQLHMVGNYTTAVSICEGQTNLPYVNYQTPGDCIGLSVNDVDLSGTMTNGVKVGTSLTPVSYSIHAIRKNSGTVTNLFTDLNASGTCTVPGTEGALIDYFLDNAGKSHSSASLADANCNNYVLAAANLGGTSVITPNLYAADSGAVNVYVVTLAPAMSSYVTGVLACFKASAANTTTTPTVNFNGLGAKTIVKLSGGALSNGDIGTTEPACVQYDGANFNLLNPVASTGTGTFARSNAPTFTGQMTVQNVSVSNLLFNNTAPTIAAAGCGGSAAAISGTANGTASFNVNVGTAPTSGGCTVTLPTAATGWNCYVNDITTNSTSVFYQKQTGGSTTTAILQNFSDVAVATAPTAADIYHVACFAN